MSKWHAPLVLASASPRRVGLLADAGIEATSRPPELDDGIFSCGTMATTKWVQTLATLKAKHVQVMCQGSAQGTILAADTVCVVDDRILGQPSSENEARAMITSMLHRTHDVYTGWCLISSDGQQLQVGCEIASIHMGHIEDDEIAKYVASGNWQGKAGAYNLAERIEAGWPITCTGDPTSVMGLPMKRLQQELSKGHC